MNIALRRPYTFEEYLAWSNTQTERQRSELINGQIVAMAPERIKHTKAKLAVAMALKAAVVRSGLPCHVLADGPTVRIDDHTAYEPDTLVYCGQELPGDALVVPNPVVIVEVLSPTTMHTDTSAKLIGYFKLPSVRHYLIVDPDARLVTHHLRSAEDSASASDVTSGTIRLDPPGLSIDVSEIFE
jgi:Uma2 family endonuclease